MKMFRAWKTCYLVHKLDLRKVRILYFTSPVFQDQQSVVVGNNILRHPTATDDGAEVKQHTQPLFYVLLLK
jgi:hypothetical protein